MNNRGFLTAAVVALASVITFAQDVTYDYDKAAKFSSFKTYSWAHGTPLNDPLNHARVVSAIDREMAAKGLVKSESGSRPDLLVAYHASFDRNLQIDASTSGWGPYGLGGNRFGSARAREVLVGTLAVEIADAESGNIVWHGMASMDVDMKAKPEKREKNLNRAAARLFKNFPTGR